MKRPLGAIVALLSLSGCRALRRRTIRSCTARRFHLRARSCRRRRAVRITPRRRPFRAPPRRRWCLLEPQSLQHPHRRRRWCQDRPRSRRRASTLRQADSTIRVPCGRRTRFYRRRLRLSPCRSAGRPIPASWPREPGKHPKMRPDAGFAAQPPSQPVAQPRPDPSIVRVVELASAAASTRTDPAILSNAQTATVQPSPPAMLAASVPATATAIPATTVTSSTAGSTLARTTERPPIQELTNLPAVGRAAASDAKPPANPTQPASQSPDHAASVSMPAELPGATYGYDPDYKALRGKLEYSVAARHWKLIYLPAEGPIDEYGGTVVLPDPSQLNGFEAGDFVTVQGTFTPPSGAGAAMFAIQRIKRQ